VAVGIASHASSAGRVDYVFLGDCSAVLILIGRVLVVVVAVRPAAAGTSVYSISCQWFLSVLDMTWMGRRCEGVWGCMYMQPVALDQLLCSMLGLSAPPAHWQLTRCAERPTGNNRQEMAS
jgi:hypothetical protein